MDTINGCHLECSTTKVDNECLASDANDENDDEELVGKHVLEDIKVAVDATRAIQTTMFRTPAYKYKQIGRQHLLDFVKDLAKDKRVENHCLQERALCGVFKHVAVKQYNHDDNLENGLSNNHFPHLERDQRTGASFRATLQEFGSGWIGGKSQCSKGIHDKIDPQQLDSRKY